VTIFTLPPGLRPITGRGLPRVHDGLL